MTWMNKREQFTGYMYSATLPLSEWTSHRRHVPPAVYLSADTNVVLIYVIGQHPRWLTATV